MYNPKSLWWFHEGLHRSLLNNYSRGIADFYNERELIEEDWMNRANAVGDGSGWELTKEAFHQARQKTVEWIERTRSLPQQYRNKWAYRRYWRLQNRKAAISI